MKKYIISLALGLILTGCSEKKQEMPASTKVESVNFNEDLFSPISESAVAVLEARKLQPGSKVVVEGKILGSESPFVDSRASFIIGDPTVLKSCDLNEGDECKTPWDVCCETKDSVAGATLSIQVVDGEGMTLKKGLKGTKGLAELKTVIIQGVVDESSNTTVMIINAEKINVK